MANNKITFSFGENWENYLTKVSKEDIIGAAKDIEKWLGKDKIENKAVLDIGSGSGIHSLVFFQVGAKSVHSFDLDEQSVEATKSLWNTAGKPENWKIMQGSILDRDFVRDLGRYDIVYSWGVLHHTGSMWEAIDCASSLVTPGGWFWIAIYAKPLNYEKILAMKMKYNASSDLGKRFMIYKEIAKRMYIRFWNFRNPFTWNQSKERGMNVYHDIVDWLGGLPYEAASEDDVLRFVRKRGFILERMEIVGGRGVNKYVFSLPEHH
jgi:SAM-dependent methyltransferase